jgi:hypothetical protein
MSGGFVNPFSLNWAGLSRWTTGTGTGLGAGVFSGLNTNTGEFTTSAETIAAVNELNASIKANTTSTDNATIATQESTVATKDATINQSDKLVD